MAGAPVDVRFMRGLDVQNDQRMVESPYLLQADNVYFDRENGPRKRPGYTVVPPTIAGTKATLSATSVIGHKSGLLALDDTNIYTFTEGGQRWVNRDVLIPCTTSSRPASPTQNRQRFFEVSRWASGYELQIYQDFRSLYDIRYSIVDPVDNSFLLYDQLLVTATSSLVTAKIVRTTTNLLVCWQNLDGWYCKAIPQDPLSSPSASQKITSSTGLASFSFDGTYTVAAVNTANSNSANSITLFRLLPGGGSIPIVIIDNGIPALNPQAIDIAPYGTGVGKFAIAYAAWNGTGFPTAISSDVYDIVANGYVQPKNAAYVFLPSPAIYVQQLAQIFTGGNLQTHVCYIQPASTGSASNYVCGYYPAYNASASSLTVVSSSLVFAARPFVYKNSVYAFCALANRALTNASYSGSTATTYAGVTPQSCVFLINVTLGRVVAQIGYGVSNPVTNRLPDVRTDGTTFEVPVLRTIKTVSSIQDVQPFQFVSSYIYGVTFTSAYQLQNARMGDIRLFAGGIINSYDGARVTEHGFLLSPDIVNMADSSTSGAVPVGVYQICAVYEWSDAQGNFYRSAPGQVATYTVTTPTTVLPQFTVNNLTATNKLNVTIALYMTKANGSIFYRVTYMPNGTDPNGTVFSPYPFPVGAVSAETLYTTGNILANDPWPSSILMTTSRNRVFTVNSEDSEVITYSKAFVKNEGIAISLAFTRRVSAVPGPISAIAAMDDKVIVFKQRAILYFYGQNGPGPDGSNDDFSNSQILTTEIGCVAQNSILTTADGVYFQSEKGVWLLSRSMNLSFVGQPVAPLAIGKNITSAVLMPKQTNIRFGALGSPSLVYHYRLQAQYGNSLVCGQWTTFSNYSQYNATIHKGLYYFARSDGKICMEKDGYYKDDASPMSFTLRTSWERVGGLMQWGHYTDLAMLGLYEGPHQLAINLYRDYRDAPDAQLRFDSTVGVTTTTWGSGSWGSQATFGGDSDNTYTSRWKLPRSYAAVGTLSMAITDTGKAGVDFGASCQILGLTLLAEANPDLAHVGDKKRQ